MDADGCHSLRIRHALHTRHALQTVTMQRNPAPGMQLTKARVHSCDLAARRRSLAPLEGICPFRGFSACAVRSGFRVDGAVVQALAGTTAPSTMFRKPESTAKMGQVLRKGQVSTARQRLRKPITNWVTAGPGG